MMKPGKKAGRTVFMLVLAAVTVVIVLVLARSPHGPEESTEVDENDAGLLFSKAFDMIHSLSFSPCGEFLALGKNKKVLLLDAETGSSEHMIELESLVLINSISFSACGRFIVLGSNSAHLYDLKEKELVSRLHGGFDSRAVFSPGGNIVASGNRGGIIWLWDAETGQEMAAMEPGATAFTSVVRFSPCGGNVVSGHFDGRLYYWDVSEREKVHKLDLGDKKFRPVIADVSVSPGGDILACVGAHHRGVFIFDLDNGAGRESPESAKGHAFCVDFSLCGRYLAAGGRNLNIFNSGEFSLLYSYEVPGRTENVGGVRLARFSPEGSLVAAVCFDNSLHMFRAAPGK